MVTQFVSLSLHIEARSAIETYHMIHQILAHSRQINLTLDLMLLQLLLAADTRSHQNSWAAVTSSADNDFLACVDGSPTAIRSRNNHTRRSKPVPTITLQNDPINSGLSHNRDITPMMFIRDIIRPCGPDPLVYGPRRITTAIGRAPGSKQVVLKRKAIRHERVHQQFRYRRKIMGFRV